MAVLHYNFHSHPKMARLSNASVGIYARLLSYASANLTDGYIPEAIIRSVCDKRRAFTALLEAELLDHTTCRQMPGKCRANARQKPHEACGKCHTGYQIHDYLDYNPSKTEVEQKRAETRARAAQRRRGKSQKSTGEQTPDVPKNVRDIGKDNYLKSRPTTTQVVDVAREDKAEPEGDWNGHAPPSAEELAAHFGGDAIGELLEFRRDTG